jgi:hypothetical protein
LVSGGGGQPASNLARALADLDRNLAGLDRTFDLELALFDAFTRVRTFVYRAIALNRNREIKIDFGRVLRVYMLNWLCVVEQRADGRLPVVEGLWLARTRQQTAAGKREFCRFWRAPTSSKASVGFRSGAGPALLNLGPRTHIVPVN